MSPERWGATPDGRTVTRYTLGAEGPVTLRVLDLGATVQELWAPDREGMRANVVLGGRGVADYASGPTDFLGAVVGRVANRIEGAVIDIDGTRYELPANDGAHQLHGGPDGFHHRLWDVEDHDERSIVLTLHSPEGDQGFPGNLNVQVRYAVSGSTVDVGIEATTDRTTPVSLTQHAHFNLAGEGSGSVDDHLLSVAASRYTPVDGALIPTGEVAEVGHSALDLRHTRRIGDVVSDAHPQLLIGRGLDVNFVLDGTGSDADAVLHDPASGRTLRLSTDQPGLQVYTANFFDGSRIGTSGRTYRQGAGVALEPQRFPGAVHHYGRPGWEPPWLAPNDIYRLTLRWAFSVAADDALHDHEDWSSSAGGD